ncbi:hypothetical protein PHMEG_00037999 [Phytophthora megakarya]|uniref:Reverse transcriptase zinc-binding domain-containing protein n=1 Tax=Phytophthora megakarya TaxID=4795 RepID=A0A225UID9_9STRA|nr:hypothetical protein PHMEG_00037999 [Phytophthora megakarya]
MKLHWDRVDDNHIKAYVKLGKRLRKVLLPIFEDLQFRLAFRLLPVRSRFWFLEHANPGIRKCVSNGCNAIESEQHLFFDCTLASSLWRHVLGIVRKLRVRDVWTDHEAIVADVWHVLRSVTLHFVWSDRNRCLFDGRQPTPTLAALQVVLTTFAAHIRYFQRRLYSPDEQNLLRDVLKRLDAQSCLGEFVDRHPGITGIRTSA